MFLFRSFLSFRLVAFRLIPVSPSSLLLSLPCVPGWRILLFCYFVSALLVHTPRAPCEPEVCVFPLRAVFFLFCVADVDLYFEVYIFSWEIDKIGYTRVVSEQNRVPFFSRRGALTQLASCVWDLPCWVEVI